MSLAPRPLDASDLALRILDRSRSNEWMAVQVPTDREQDIADELSEAVEDIDDVTVERVHVDSADALIASMQRPGGIIRILSGFDDLPEAGWHHIDQARSRLAREGCVVLVVSAEGIQRMFRGAPNLASWIGAATWSFDATIPTLSAEEKEQRLNTLRAWSSLNDAEVIERAERGMLPGDPEYAEWLILLDRGDLILPRDQEDDR